MHRGKTDANGKPIRTSIRMPFTLALQSRNG
jgi:hypothetical protein